MENPFDTLDKRLTGMEEMLRTMLSMLPDNSLRVFKEKYLDTKQAAAFINKTENALRQLVHKNVIPHIKKGGKLAFLESELKAWLETGRVKTASEMKEDPESILISNKRGN